MPEDTKSSRHDGLDYWIKNMTNEDLKNYIQYRVIEQIDWYRNKSRKYKKQYQLWTVAALIIGALIPIFSVFSDGSILMKTAIAALGSSSAAISAFLTQQNYKELWQQYRNTRELLLSTLYLYFNQQGPFKDGDQAARDGKLIEQCESYLSQEVQHWKGLRQ